ncbi:MAG: ATP synthase F1 subunit gamma [Muribaculaceae bacterium]
MATLRELKGRIGSVASSEKITGAMKMISSAKMHKAEGALRRLQPYRSTIETIIANLLSADVPFTSPLVEDRPLQRVTLVVLGSDDGLCGAYNVNLAKFVENHIDQLFANHGFDITIDIVAVGKKMAKACQRLARANVYVIESTEVNSKSEGEQVKSFEANLRNQFLNGDTDCVEILYMHFRSAGKQVATADKFLPLSPANFSTEKATATARPYLFEPNAADIFAGVLPMYLLSMAQEVFIENCASEQAARVMAMQSANDNAKKLLDQLRLEYNKLRQQSITTELLDIVGGQVRD